MSKTISELKSANLPVATPESIGLKVGELNDATHKALSALTDYLKRFVSGDKCPQCDREFGGIFGSFVWGMAHGEGMCAECKYPMRAVHKIEGLGTIRNFILPYHPSVLEPTP